MVTMTSFIQLVLLVCWIFVSFSEESEFDNLGFSVDEDPFYTWDAANKDTDEMLELRTSGGREKTIWLTTDRHYLLFTLSTCSPAMLGLASSPGEMDSVHHTILLDPTDPTTPIQLLNSSGDPLDVQSPVNATVDCGVPGEFWLAWANSQIIVVGQGHVVPENPVLYANYLDFNVTALTFSADYVEDEEDVATWTMSKTAGRVVEIHNVTDTDTTSATWTNAYSAFSTFRVRACSEAVVYLTSGLSGNHTYGIMLGNDSNTKTEILDVTRGVILASEETQRVLHCNWHILFWVSWDQDHIRVGHGHVNGERLLAEALVEGMSNAELGVSFGRCAAETTSCDWILSSVPADSYEITTVASTTVTDAIVMTSLHYVEFKLQSWGGVRVALATSPLSLETRAIHILLNNSESAITIVNNNDTYILVTNDTSQLLSSENSRPFWIGWGRGKVEVGLGGAYEGDVFLEMEPNSTEIDLISLYTVGMATLETSITPIAWWRLNKNLARQVKFTTGGDDSFFVGPSHLWSDCTGCTSASAQVRACGNAHVLLATYSMPSLPISAYDIGLGLGENSDVVEINKYNSAGTHELLVTTQMSSSLLDCDSVQLLLVTWERKRNGSLVIWVGRGPARGQGTIATFVDDKPIPINAINFKSSEQVKADWTLGQFTSHAYNIKSMAGASTQIRFATYESRFVFSVKAKEEAILTLREGMSGLGNLDDIMIGIGIDGNAMTSIRHGDQWLDPVETLGILSPNEFRDFWVSWDRDEVRLGHGSHVHHELILSIPYTGPKLYFVTIGTASSIGHWKVPRQNNNQMAMLETWEEADAGMFEHYWITGVTGSDLKYKVKSRYHAAVAMSAFPGLSRALTYVATVGEQGNRLTSIQWRYGHNTKVSAATPNVLSENEYRDFWVSWRRGQVKVGQGKQTGDLELLSYVLDEPHDVTSISISTAENADGSWELPEYEDDMTVVPSWGDGVPAASIYTRLQWFHFSVRACSSAVIALERQVFWLTWSDRKIKIGRGTVPGRRMITEYWEDDWQGIENGFLDEIVAVHLTTYDGEMGEWRFHQQDGFNATVIHTPDVNYTTPWLTFKQSYVTFSVQTCESAELILSHIPAVPTYESYKITLSNGKSYIHRDSSAEAVESRDTYDLIHCDQMRPFWITWDDGWIQVGQGLALGDMPLLKFNDSEPYQINGISLTTPGDEGFWEFLPSSMNTYQFRTGQETLGEGVWLYPNQEYINFTVQACRDAQVGLAFTPGNMATDSYTVVLYSNRTSRLIYTDNKGEKSIMAETTTRRLLHCHMPVKFKISWEDLFIQVTVITDRGSNVILSTEVKIPDITAVTFATGSETSGLWEINQYNDDTLMFSTDGDNSFEDFAVTTRGRDSLAVAVRACSHAYFMLGSVFGDMRTQTYKVILGSGINDLSMIVHENNDTPMNYSITTEILDCEEWRAFWISWDKGSILVGYGAEIGRKVFMNTDIPINHQVVQVYMDTGSQEAGSWHLVGLDGNTYTVGSKDTLTNGDPTVSIIPSGTSLPLRLRVCEEGYVSLTSLQGETNFVGFGTEDNSQTAIGNLGSSTIMESSDTQGIVSCDEDRTFRVGWEEGVLNVTSGCCGIIQWNDSNVSTPNISRVQLKTPYDSEGRWQIPTAAGAGVEVYTRGLGAAYSEFWQSTLGITSLVFNITARKDAMVLLTTALYKTRPLVYEIKLGHNSNQKSKITRLDTDLSEEAETPDILNSNEKRSFWISWPNLRINVGRGTVVGEDMFLTLHLEYNIPIGAFSFSTGAAVSGVWHLEDYSYIDEVVTTEAPSETTVDDHVTGVTSEPTAPSQTRSTSISSTSTSSTSTTTTSTTSTTFSTYSTADSLSTAETEENTDSGGLSAGEIVAITFAVAVALAVLVAVVFFGYKYYRLKEYGEFAESAQPIENPTYEGNTMPMTDDPFDIRNASNVSHFDNPFVGEEPTPSNSDIRLGDDYGYD